MKYVFNINDRAAKAIIKGEKKVEIRANTKGNNYGKYKENDIIEFHSDECGIFYAMVKVVNHYNTIEDLLTLEGTKYTLSSTNVFNEGVKSINSLSGYEKAIKESGVYAIHLEYLYSQDNVWEKLYNKARNVAQVSNISNLVSAGSVSAAILTKNHHIYTGVCIDTACSLGMCAERNAISTMITNGEKEISKLVCVGANGNTILPCGACREALMQLDKGSKNIEIMLNYQEGKTITLKELIPNWWGDDRI